MPSSTTTTIVFVLLYRHLPLSGLIKKLLFSISNISLAFIASPSFLFLSLPHTTQQVSSAQILFDVGLQAAASSFLLLSLFPHFIYLFNSSRGSLIAWLSKLVPSLAFVLDNRSLLWSISTSHSAMAGACVTDRGCSNFPKLSPLLWSRPILLCCFPFHLSSHVGCLCQPTDH